MSIVKGLAHLALIWFAIVAALCGAALLMATFDVMGNLGRSAYSRNAT